MFAEGGVEAEVVRVRQQPENCHVHTQTAEADLAKPDELIKANRKRGVTGVVVRVQGYADKLPHPDLWSTRGAWGCWRRMCRTRAYRMGLAWLLPIQTPKQSALRTSGNEGAGGSFAGIRHCFS
jgi:hypothetical protein